MVTAATLSSKQEVAKVATEEMAAQVRAEGAAVMAPMRHNTLRVEMATREALEAMATALPVVVSDLKCFRDFIVPGRDALIFDHRAPAPGLALGELLGQTLTDSHFALQLGRNAADRAQDFELQKIARRYIGFFEEIARS